MKLLQIGHPDSVYPIMIRMLANFITIIIVNNNIRELS